MATMTEHKARRTHDTSSLMYLNPSMLPSVDTQIQPLIDTANPAIN